MLRKPSAKPYLVIGAIFTVVAIISISVKISSHNSNIFLALAMLLSAIGSLAWVYAVKIRAYDAAQKYEKILKAGPENPGFLYNLAIAGLISGDKAYALEKLVEFVSKYPEHSLAQKARGLKSQLQLKNRIKNAELCYAGEQLRRENKLLAAEKEFLSEIAVNPKADWAYYGLGLIYAQTGDIARAKDYFSKFKAIIPDQRDIRGAIAKKILKDLSEGKSIDVNQLIESKLKKSRRVAYVCLGYLAIVLLAFLVLLLFKGC